MRVLITTDIYPPDSGGPATYVPFMANALSDQGHDVKVLTYSQVADYPDDARQNYVVERIVLDGGRVQRLARTFARLVADLRHADVIYVNGLLIETALANILLRRPAVAKVVGDIVWERARDKGWITDDFEGFQSGRYSRAIEMRRRLRNWALRRMRRVVVPSRYLGAIVAGWGIEPGRIQVIYNAFEPAHEPVTAAELPLSTPHKIVTVCRLTGWKGVDALIDVVATLPDVGLVVVGDGPERVNLEAQTARLNVQDRVHFAGQVPGARVRGFLLASDLFVLNSSYEGLPHVVLEAISAGLPVVASAAGGTPEVVEDGVNGALVPVGDHDALRAAIVDWLGRKEQMTAGQPGAIPEQFRTETMSAATTQLLTSVARGS